MAVQHHHQPSGLIHLGPGISPTCPRHGRAAQMLLAAAAANRSGMTAGGGGGSGGSSITTPPPPLQMNLSNNNSTIPPTQKVQANINIVDGLSSLNGQYSCDNKFASWKCSNNNKWRCLWREWKRKCWTKTKDNGEVQV
ncbi:hypothetical protein ACQ4LE_011083 [Meloidogyne hapla]